MAILLDTHVLIWVAEDSPQLKSETAALINEAGMAGEVLVSVFSLWEVALLVIGRRLALSGPLDEWTAAVAAEPRLTIIPLSPQIAIDCHRLPGRLHGDPADRILVATARELSATLLTHDRRILRYGDEGHVQVMAA